MAVGINQAPQLQKPQQEEQPLDKIMKALEIGKNIFGIASDIKGIKKADQEIEFNKQEAARRESAGQRESTTFQQGQEQRTLLMDPNSPQSQALRRRAQALGLPVEANARGADIDQKQLSDNESFILQERERRKTEMAKRAGEKAGKEPTAEQGNIAGFAKRVEQAEGIFSKLEGEGFKREDSYVQGSRFFPEMAKSGQFKQQQQAERNFINSILRRESGAAISPSEFENAESQYFPRAGDTAEVLDQKKQNRLLASESLRAAAGNAMERINFDTKPKNKSLADTMNDKTKDADALAWAKSNPNSPMSKQIFDLNGVKPGKVGVK